MKYILILFLILNIGFAKDFTPKLQSKEKKFKKSLLYKFKDFNFKWDISFLTVVSFEELYKENRKLKYKNLKPIFKTDNRVFSKKIKRDILYLANLMSNRKNYPIKKTYGPWGYTYYVVIFIDNKGKMFALENYKELKDMLGVIDTPAELLVWLRLKYGEYPYSYLFKNTLWQVRYSNWSLGKCYYSEYFKYYNNNGKFIKEVKIKNYHKKGCIDPVM